MLGIDERSPLAIIAVFALMAAAAVLWMVLRTLAFRIRYFRHWQGLRKELLSFSILAIVTMNLYALFFEMPLLAWLISMPASIAFTFVLMFAVRLFGGGFED